MQAEWDENYDDDTVIHVRRRGSFFASVTRTYRTPAAAWNRTYSVLGEYKTKAKASEAAKCMIANTGKTVSTLADIDALRRWKNGQP